MSLEMVLKRVAVAQHKQRVKKINSRIKQQQATALEKTLFDQSKIPEMWEAVADIEVPNPAPEAIDGIMVRLKDLKVPWSQFNHTGAGLELYDKNDAIANWSVRVEIPKTGSPIASYIANGYKFNMCERRNTTEKGPNTAETNFVETFVKWLSRKIPPTTLIDLGIDFNAIATIEKEIAEAVTPTPKRKISRV